MAGLLFYNIEGTIEITIIKYSLSVVPQGTLYLNAVFFPRTGVLGYSPIVPSERKSTKSNC